MAVVLATEAVAGSFHFTTEILFMKGIRILKEDSTLLDEKLHIKIHFFLLKSKLHNHLSQRSKISLKYDVERAAKFLIISQNNENVV